MYYQKDHSHTILIKRIFPDLPQWIRPHFTQIHGLCSVLQTENENERFNQQEQQSNRDIFIQAVAE